jgi:hypothetical protein
MPYHQAVRDCLPGNSIRDIPSSSEKVDSRDRTVRTAGPGVSQYSWNLALNPADGQFSDSRW